MNPRERQLHTLAANYVASLGRGDFDSIPYDADVVLRAPLCPSGSNRPLAGRDNLRERWWAPLPSLIAGTELIETFINQGRTAVAAEFFCHIKSPRCTLRIIDRFTVNEAGLITAQENFFDPRDVTHPGWQSS